MVVQQVLVVAYGIERVGHIDPDNYLCYCTGVRYNDFVAVNSSLPQPSLVMLHCCGWLLGFTFTSASVVIQFGKPV
ncbi:hypothetical protein ANO14919_001970 [Xylariales sp. No.14919]|nr:hypothetical protein ANO14919_001970 [Xylariales sp. No.14919]